MLLCINLKLFYGEISGATTPSLWSLLTGGLYLFIAKNTYGMFFCDFYCASGQRWTKVMWGSRPSILAWLVIPYGITDVVKINVNLSNSFFT